MRPLQVPLSEGEPFEEAAAKVQEHTQKAVKHAAAAAGLRLVSTTSATTHGCVHIVMTADTSEPLLPGQQRQEIPPGQLQQQLQEKVTQQLVLAGVLPGAGDDDGDGAAAAHERVMVSELGAEAAAGGFGGGSLQGLLVRPVCLPLVVVVVAEGPLEEGAAARLLAPAVSSGPGTARLVVEAPAAAAAAAAGLAAGGQVAVLVDDSSQAGSAVVDCYTAAVEASGDGTSVEAGVEVAVGLEPALLLLHLLSQAAAATADAPAATSAAGSKVPHPLASLALLVLPET